VDLPLNLIIECLTGFCVCYFKDKRHSPESPPHYYVTVPITNDTSLLLCIITSQVENQMWYYRNVNVSAISSLVRVDQSSLPFLTKESFIDCNRAELIRKNEFIKIVDSKPCLEIKTRDVPDELKREIISAINKSPLVKSFIKRLIISNY
jgi:hypothetical protein